MEGTQGGGGGVYRKLGAGPEQLGSEGKEPPGEALEDGRCHCHQQVPWPACLPLAGTRLGSCRVFKAASRSKLGPGGNSLQSLGVTALRFCPLKAQEAHLLSWVGGRNAGILTPIDCSLGRILAAQVKDLKHLPLINNRHYLLTSFWVSGLTLSPT